MSNSGHTPGIVFVARAYPPIRGGLEQFSYDLTTEITARTHTSIVANRAGKSFLPIFIPLAAARVFKNRNQFDVCHLCDPVLAPVARMISSLPVTMNVHGLDIVHSGNVYQRYLKTFFPYADLYICVSTYVQELVHTHTQIRRTVVIPNGIRDTFYRSSITKNNLAQLLKRPDVSSRPVLLTVGRLIKRKGVAWFIRSVLPLLSKDILYVVAGHGPEQAAIERATQDTNTEDRVILTGAVSNGDLRTLYNASDIFVMPNLPLQHDVEGFGLVSLEAASCKTPVVASATHGITDAVHHEQNGTLVEPQHEEQYVEAINALLSDDRKRMQFGERAREFTLKNFSWNVIGDRYLTTFRTIVR